MTKKMVSLQSLIKQAVYARDNTIIGHIAEFLSDEKTGVIRFASITLTNGECTALPIEFLHYQGEGELHTSFDSAVIYSAPRDTNANLLKTNAGYWHSLSHYFSKQPLERTKA